MSVDHCYVFELLVGIPPGRLGNNIRPPLLSFTNPQSTKVGKPCRFIRATVMNPRMTATTIADVDEIRCTALIERGTVRIPTNGTTLHENVVH
jgi:hypothetical protein